MRTTSPDQVPEVGADCEQIIDRTARAIHAAVRDEMQSRGVDSYELVLNHAPSELIGAYDAMSPDGRCYFRNLAVRMYSRAFASEVAV